MNKLLESYHDYILANGVRIATSTWAILETPCYPCSFYFGQVILCGKEWLTADNRTSNFHSTIEEAQSQARKMFPQYHFA